MLSRYTSGLIGLSLLAIFSSSIQPAKADSCRMPEQKVMDKLSDRNSFVFHDAKDIDVFRGVYALKADPKDIIDVDHVRVFERENNVAEAVFVKNGCAIASAKMSDKEFQAHWDSFLTKNQDALLERVFTSNMRLA